jgi:hypothetical protein
MIAVSPQSGSNGNCLYVEAGGVALGNQNQESKPK